MSVGGEVVNLFCFEGEQVRLSQHTCHPLGCLCVRIVAARLQVPDERAESGESDT